MRKSVGLGLRTGAGLGLIFGAGGGSGGGAGEWGGGRPPRPENFREMSKRLKGNWERQGGKVWP